MINTTAFLETCYRVAVSAALPDHALKAVLPARPKGRLIVVGAGKGAAQLARAFERSYEGPIEGVVVTRYGFGVPCERLKVIEAAHPVPDENSALAAQALLEQVRGLSSDDLVVALITGGGSALLAAPLSPMEIEDEIALNKVLLSSGAPIGAMNTLRRHLSAIKGGRLAAQAHPAQLVTYLISDVPGDDPAEIASGPTISGDTTPDDARAVIERYQLNLPPRVLQALETPEAVAPDVKGGVHILASAAKSLAAVEAFARKIGYDVISLGDAIEGEAREVAQAHAEFVFQKQAEGWKGLIISGGETTVTLQGGGKGGRNSEYLLALALALSGVEGVSFFAADTDGVDGSEENAGAFGNGASVAHMAQTGIDAQAYLADNDAYTAFAAINALFSPGPSGTNVNDLRLILLS